MAIWDDVMTGRDRAVFEKAGYGKRGGLGEQPALIVIDMTYAFTGDRREGILESVARWPHSCGEAGWDAVAPIGRLLVAARAAGAPVVYTRGEFRPDASDAGRWAGKLTRGFEEPADRRFAGDQFVGEIAPQPGDLVIKKDKPSAFFGTPLMSYLNERRIDSLIVTGSTTSGCVRATVVDGFSYNFRVAVVEEATFDRGEVSHKVNLFDLNQKYADVISTQEAVSYLAALERKRLALASAGGR